MNFGDEHICIATREDLISIEQLLNNAYRGEASKKGWTTEADLIAGDVRTNLDSLNEVYEKEGSIFLKYVDNDGELLGCVNFQKIDNKVYLGMFAVSPIKQGSGIGKKMLAAADLYANAMNAIAIFMSVVSVRKELIDWYLRHGYEYTGERKEFKEDGVSGKHLRDLEFVILEKSVQ